MTVLKCDRCKQEVTGFKVEGSANFPDGYHEVCVTCWEKVRDAVGVAEEAASAARDKTFNQVFKREVEK